MASTYSTSLRLELIGDGDQSGIWGQTTNNNLGSLVEQSVAGVVTISMVDANYTLSNYNGVTDESRNAVLIATGTNSAIRQIICPLVEKLYVIYNNTTGGYAITIGGSSGSIITVPNGVTAQVYCDGVSFFSSQTGSAGNFNVNGNLTVAGSSSLSTGSISGIVTAPTAASGTSTTQLATTAFVTTAVTTYFPAGTRIPFAQAAAPTGWTQDTSDNATNRMLRVVNTAGNGVGGSASPILMNVVPSHTHTINFTSGGQSTDHTHVASGNTGTMSANNTHNHTGTTDGMDRNNPHSHGTGAGDYYLYSNPGGPEYLKGGPDLPFTRTGGTGSADINHLHNFTTSTVDINHSHAFSVNTGGTSTNHQHTIAGTSDANASASNWAPRYIDLIICAKN